MKRRLFLKRISAVGTGASLFPPMLSVAEVSRTPKSEATSGAERVLTKDWLTKWEHKILDSSKTRYCDRETGEEIGWLISPFLEGFFYGYKATGDLKWVRIMTDWAEAWIKRGVREPDGFVGWPKLGTGGKDAKEFLTDSLLGEAMGLRPLLLMAGEIRKTPTLLGRFGAPAESWINLSEQVFEKWNERGCWREVRDGGLWVVPPFGIDQKTGKWTDGYERRAVGGFSNPANKENHIARWLLSMGDITGKAAYYARARQWFRKMKANMRIRGDGKYYVWNYWDPAGPWDYDPAGSVRHWVGVHPNGGYYSIDVAGIVAAFEHDLVFTRDDINRLIATNRDFMWNQKLEGARFQRIDGGTPDSRWKDSPGVLWTALLPYDETLRRIYRTNHNPASWSGLAATPWFVEVDRAVQTK